MTFITHNKNTFPNPNALTLFIYEADSLLAL